MHRGPELHDQDATGLAPVCAGTDATDGYVVYRLLGEDFKVLYIGCTGNLPVRLGNHRCKQPWWPEVICYSLEYHGKDRAGAYAAELAAIRSENPPYCRVPNRLPIAERFWSKVAIGEPEECWNWTASRNGDYGQFAVEPATPRTAHSVAYELTHGVRSSKRSGVRQTCGNRRCVNPAHLVLGRVTGPIKTHCIHGHEYDEANTYIVAKTGNRQCRKCVAANGRAYYARKANLTPA